MANPLGVATGIGYDNVSLVAVPEPSVFGLLGFAAFATMARRRRSHS